MYIYIHIYRPQHNFNQSNHILHREISGHRRGYEAETLLHDQASYSRPREAGVINQIIN